jgi:uncharacterized membrane protein YraQ (UPF0718 family)
MNIIKRFKLAIAVLGVDIALLVFQRDTGIAVVRATLNNLWQMVQFLPAIFLLLGLLDVWVSRQTVVTLLGKRSGLIGISLAVLIGAAAAGPLYGAFPVASRMLNKGASVFNVMVFLGAWANLKIPMVIFETVSLGSTFATTRWIANIIGIVVIAWLIQRSLGESETAQIYELQKTVQAPGPKRAQ